MPHQVEHVIDWANYMCRFHEVKHELYVCLADGTKPPERRVRYTGPVCERCGNPSMRVEAGKRLCAGCWIFLNQMKGLGALIGYGPNDQIPEEY